MRLVVPGLGENDRMWPHVRSASLLLGQDVPRSVVIDYDLSTWDEAGWDTFGVSITDVPYHQLQQPTPTYVGPAAAMLFEWGGQTDAAMETASGTTTINIPADAAGKWLNFTLGDNHWANNESPSNLGMHDTWYPSWGTFRLYTADLDVDSNNDGTIDAADAAVEDQGPGVIIPVGGGTELRLSVFPPDASGTVELTVPSGADKVELYEDEELTTPLALTSWPAGQQPPSVWAKAIEQTAAAGDIRFALAFQPSGSTQPATDQANAAGVKFKLLLGANDANDESVHDDWVGAKDPATNRTHKINNFLRAEGTQGAQVDLTVDYVRPPNGGTVNLIGFDAAGNPLPPGPITGRLTLGNQGQGIDWGEFFIEGIQQSAAPEDLEVEVKFKGTIVASETFTVIRFNAEPETGGDSPVPVNPAVVNSDSDDVNGNVFAADIGRPGFDDPDSNHSSQYPGGALLPNLQGSNKIPIDKIEVVWARKIETNAAIVLDRSSDAQSPLLVNPPNKGFGTVDADDNLRVRDVDFPAWAEVPDATVHYLLGHPTEITPALDIFDNFANSATARAAPTVTFPVAVHVMQLLNAAGQPIGTLQVTLNDVTNMLNQTNTIWSQAGIRFSLAQGNFFSPQTTQSANEFDVEDGDASTSADNVTAINNRADAIDLYIVRSITNPNVWPSNDEAIAGTTRYPGMPGNSGVLVAKEFKDTEAPIGPNINRSFTDMGRTLAHELGHYLMKSGFHDTRVWNLMVAGDSLSKRDLLFDTNPNASDAEDQINKARTRVAPATPDQ